MPQSTITFKVFVSSPGDVKREREAMLGVANTVNGVLESLLPEDGYCIKPYLWESAVPSKFGLGPQGA